MDANDGYTVHCINPHYFPAKLWRLVNDPASPAVRWDASGEGLVVHQPLFEKQLLTASGSGGDHFKTTNFASFIRQLNLYGFRKVVSGAGGPPPPPPHATPSPAVEESGVEHRFRNPYFRRSRPELLVNLRRLTSSNKAKMQAGLEVNCRPPRRYHQFCHGNIEDGGGSFLGRRHQATAWPYSPSGPRPIEEYSRTPIPSRNSMMGDGNTPCIPISGLHRYPGESSSPTAVHIQQGVHGPANPGQKFYNFIAHTPQCQPAYYSSAYECYLPSSVSSDITGTGNQTSPYSHLGYYQPNGPVGFLYPGNHNKDSQSGENQDLKKNNKNLETAFQIIEEFQLSPQVCMVKVMTPKKPGPLAGPSTSIHSFTLPTSSQASASSSVDVKPPMVCYPNLIGMQGNIQQGTSTKDIKPIKEEMIEEPIFKHL
ncbi:unnamed protein product [Merluccius merluccius]